MPAMLLSFDLLALHARVLTLHRRGDDAGAAKDVAATLGESFDAELAAFPANDANAQRLNDIGWIAGKGGNRNLAAAILLRVVERYPRRAIAHRNYADVLDDADDDPRTSPTVEYLSYLALTKDRIDTVFAKKLAARIDPRAAAVRAAEPAAALTPAVAQRLRDGAATLRFFGCKTLPLTVLIDGRELSVLQAPWGEVVDRARKAVPETLIASPAGTLRLAWQRASFGGRVLYDAKPADDCVATDLVYTPQSFVGPFFAYEADDKPRHGLHHAVESHGVDVRTGAAPDLFALLDVPSFLHAVAKVDGVEWSAEAKAELARLDAPGFDAKKLRAAFDPYKPCLRACAAAITGYDAAADLVSFRWAYELDASNCCATPRAVVLAARPGPELRRGLLAAAAGRGFFVDAGAPRPRP